MSLSFERATPADAETLVRVQIVSFHSDAALYPGQEEDGPPGYDSVEHALTKIRDDICYRITHDGATIGVIIIVDAGDGHMHLDVLAIEPAFQNRGIGTAALRFIEQAHPARRWTLDTPGYATRNHYFYERLGYVKVGEEEHPSVTLFAYEKRLERP